MANLGIEIKRKCPICGKVFMINTLDSIYCSPKCSKIANKRKKEALFATYAQNVPDIREYLTEKQVVALYGIERSTLYRLAKSGKIPCINLDIRLMHFKRSELDLLFHYRRDLKETKEVPQKTLYYKEDHLSEGYQIYWTASLLINLLKIVSIYILILYPVSDVEIVFTRFTKSNCNISHMAVKLWHSYIQSFVLIFV